MRNEYPRPTLTRGEDSYLSLNGEWLFRDSEIKDEELYFDISQYGEHIIVPFVPESKASGIGRYTAEETVHYLRKFSLSKNDFSAGRVLIHFGAVDYECSVFVNGEEAGTHRGGYVPFYFDITELVSVGDNAVSVKVTDHTADRMQPSGKQDPDDVPSGCHYTRCTGIWQSVWLEFVPKIYVDDIFCRPDVAGSGVDIGVTVAGEETDDEVLYASVSYRGKRVAEGSAVISDGEASIYVKIPDPVLWDIGKGELYDVTVNVGKDTVSTYFGMRSIATEGKKVLLNGRPIFMRLLLDQGYNPDGIYTATDPSEFRRDIKLMQDAGFNGARMHMKIFEPGYIRAADEAGFLLWGEYPNWGLRIKEPEATDIFTPEWMAEIIRDRNCPSIIGWCPFNEDDPGKNVEIMKVARAVTRELDPTRLFIDSSGWTHSGGGDVDDVNDYGQDPEVLRERYAVIDENAYVSILEWGNGLYDGKLPYFISEFGGAGFDLDSEQVHKFDDTSSKEAWGYGDAPKSAEELFERFAAQCRVFLENKDVCGFCYTQFCDIMQEINGIYTYDRRPKFDMARAKEVLCVTAEIEKTE